VAGEEVERRLVTLCERPGQEDERIFTRWVQVATVEYSKQSHPPQPPRMPPFNPHISWRMWSSAQSFRTSTTPL